MIKEIPEGFFDNFVDDTEDYEEEYVEELESYSERLEEEVKKLPDNKEDYFDFFVEECSEVFDTNFVNYEHDETHEQKFWLVLEDEKGEEWEVSANPLEYARYEVHSGMSYIEFLKTFL